MSDRSIDAVADARRQSNCEAVRLAIIFGMVFGVVIGVPAAIAVAAYLDPEGWGERWEEISKDAAWFGSLVWSCLVFFGDEISRAKVLAGVSIVVLAIVWWVGAKGMLLRAELRDWPASIDDQIARHEETNGVRAIVRTFLHRYADQETKQISGRHEGDQKKYWFRKADPNPKNRIYTSFVAYSSLVKVVLDLLKNGDDADEIVCFATISMPLPQWFNNRLDITKSGFPFVGVDAQWAKYAQQMHEFAREGDRVKIYRLLKVFEGDESKGPFQAETKMRELARASLLMKANDGGVHSYASWPPPLQGQALEHAIQGMSDAVRARYHDSLAAYVIVPHGDEGPAPHNFVWRPVYEAFVGLFGPQAAAQHRSWVYFIDNGNFGERFDPEDGVPNDLFLIGRRRKDSHDACIWLFLMAGTTDEGCRMVRLEYGTEKMGGKRIQAALRFARETLAFIEDPTANQDFLMPLKRWVDQGRAVRAPPE